MIILKSAVLYEGSQTLPAFPSDKSNDKMKQDYRGMMWGEKFDFLEKINPVGVELFHADGQTDVTKQILSFLSFANAPKNSENLIVWEIWSQV